MFCVCLFIDLFILLIKHIYFPSPIVGYPDKKVPPQTEIVETDSGVEKVIVYIFHYYDDFGANEQKVNSLKDFLIKSSLYESVKTIEDDLPSILNNVHRWIDDCFKKRSEDGRIQKIILVDSKEEDEVCIYVFFKSIQCLNIYMHNLISETLQFVVVVYL